MKGTEYNTRVTSRPYKSPEILLEHKYYDYQIDIWSCGTIMASMIFKINHLFLEKNDKQQLKALVKFFGVNEFEKLLLKY